MRWMIDWYVWPEGVGEAVGIHGDDATIRISKGGWLTGRGALS